MGDFQLFFNNQNNNIYASSNNLNNDNVETISDVINVDENAENLLKESQEEINNNLQNNEILDELLENNDNQLLPLELNTYEQIKLYLSDNKGFFTSSLINEISSIALSDNSMNNIKFQNEVGDIIIIFNEVCKKIKNIEKNYGIISKKDIIDEISIMSLEKISDNIIVDGISYSSFNVKNAFNEIRNSPLFFAELNINNTLNSKFNDLINKNIEINDNILSRAKNTIESKNKILDVIHDIQKYATFMSRDANKCNNMNDFIEKCLLILNETTNNLSNINNKNDDDGIILNNLINDNTTFFNYIIKSEDKHIPCGISIFDSLTNGGFEKERIYLLSGKTGGGKSTVLINIAYGMIKCGNGLFLSEIDILKNICEENKFNKFKNYFYDNINKLNEVDKNKHIILYVTLENSERETLKRLLLRSSLSTDILWELLSRDKFLSKNILEKGLINISYNDMPMNMNEKLKIRLMTIFNFLKITNTNIKTSFKVWWRAPYTISSYDIFLECKSLERKGYVVDGIFIDYPDKMKPLDSDIRKGDQSWDTLGKIIDNLKGLSKQASVPIIGVSQVTRQTNKDSYNKNNIIKGGSTAGSQQKESNTDTLINMNINAKSDEELTERTRLYKKYERIINQRKTGIANDIFNGNINDINELNLLNINSIKSNDMLQLSFSIPEIQTINNYVVKNRDGISDLSFDSYINYGMYLVTDFADEAINSAEFAADTCQLIIDYLHKNKLINDETRQIFGNNLNNFQLKKNQFKNIINNEINSGTNNILNNNIPSAPK